MSTEIRIYMPNLTDASQVADLKANKPFIMKASIPNNSSFLGVVSIPSIIDLMGFSGGGGPPGYVYAVDPNEECELTLFMAVAPNKPFPELVDNISIVPLGASQSVGILFGHVKAFGSGVRDGSAEKAVKDLGGIVVDMICYEPPPILKTLYDPKLQKAISGEG